MAGKNERGKEGRTEWKKGRKKKTEEREEIRGKGHEKEGRKAAEEEGGIK